MPNFSIDKTGGMGPSEIRVKPTAMNLGDSQKVGYIKISGSGFSQTIKLTQKVGNYTYQYVFTTSQNNLSFDANGGTKSVEITSQRITLLGETEIKREDWTYSVKSQDQGLTVQGNQITMPENQTNNQITKTVTYAQNDSENTIQITCTQNAGSVSEQYIFTVSPTEIPISKDGGNASVSVDSRLIKTINGNEQVTSIDYQASPSATWIQINGTQITVGKNEDTKERSGTITFTQNGSDKTQTVAITQEAATPVCEYYIQLKQDGQVIFEWSEDRHDESVTINANTAGYSWDVKVWRVWSDGRSEDGKVESYGYEAPVPDWISPVTATGDITNYTFTVEANLDTVNSRTATLRFSSNYGISYPIKIIQKAAQVVWSTMFNYESVDLDDLGNPQQGSDYWSPGFRVTLPVKSTYRIKYILKEISASKKINNVDSGSISLVDGFTFNENLVGYSGPALRTAEGQEAYPEVTFTIESVDNSDKNNPAIVVRFEGLNSSFDTNTDWILSTYLDFWDTSGSDYSRRFMLVYDPKLEDLGGIFEGFDTSNYIGVFSPEFFITPEKQIGT